MSIRKTMSQASLATALKRLPPELHSDFMEALVQSGITVVDIFQEKPFFIIAGPWPGFVHGSERSNCEKCNMYVSLDPNAGGAAKKKWPDVPVLCLPCAQAHAKANGEDLK